MLAGVGAPQVMVSITPLTDCAIVALPTPVWCVAPQLHNTSVHYTHHEAELRCATHRHNTFINTQTFHLCGRKHLSLHFPPRLHHQGNLYFTTYGTIVLQQYS